MRHKFLIHSPVLFILIWFSVCNADKNDLVGWINLQMVEKQVVGNAINWSLTFCIRNISNRKVTFPSPAFLSEIGGLRIVRKSLDGEHIYQKISTREYLNSKNVILNSLDTTKMVLGFTDVCDTISFKSEMEIKLDKTCKTIIIRTKDKELKSEVRACSESDLKLKVDSLKSKYLKNPDVKNVSVTNCELPQGYFTEWVEKGTKTKYGDLLCHMNDSIAIEYSANEKTAKTNSVWHGTIMTPFMSIGDIYKASK
jgi:hypothetical protein